MVICGKCGRKVIKFCLPLENFLQTPMLVYCAVFMFNVDFPVIYVDLRHCVTVLFLCLDVCVLSVRYIGT